MTKKNLQGISNNVRFTFSVRDTRWAIIMEQDKENFVTSNARFSVVSVM
jgi:hypothetical protein